MTTYKIIQSTLPQRNLKGGKWFMLEHQLSDNFDTVFHPDVTKDPLVNEAAQDDF